MRYKLIYREAELGNAWRKHFDGLAEIEVLEGDIGRVPCDAIVSPANSFGFMDGGLDYALSDRFGWDLQIRLQAMIARRPLRELLVGEALIVPTEDPEVPWLISAPTMRVPMKLRQTVNAYLAMKAILTTVRCHALHPTIEVVAIPGLGTGCGALPFRTAALQMSTAFREIVLGEGTHPVAFGDAQRRHCALNPNEINIWDP